MNGAHTAYDIEGTAFERERVEVAASAKFHLHPVKVGQFPGDLEGRGGQIESVNRPTGIVLGDAYGDVAGAAANIQESDACAVLQLRP